MPLICETGTKSCGTLVRHGLAIMIAVMLTNGMLSIAARQERNYSNGRINVPMVSLG